MLLITGLASAFLFGAATPASKILLADMDAQVLAGLLYIGGGLCCLPAVTRKKTFRHPWQAGRRTLLLLAGAIVLGGILGPLLLLYGLRLAGSGTVSLWLNLEFAATVVLGHFVFREQLTNRGWMAAGGTLIAAVLLAGRGGDAGIISFVLVASACLCWGFDNHFTALIDGITPAQTTLWKGLVAGVFNLVLGVALSGGIGKVGAVVSALVVGTVSYGLSNILYVTAAQGFGASRSQMIFSTAPFFGVLLAVAVLGETFTGTQFLATVIIAVSMVVLLNEKHAHLHRHDSMFHQHSHRHTDGHHDHVHGEGKDEENHSHWHEHESLEHGHKHWPDVHHRHDHKEKHDKGGSS